MVESRHYMPIYACTYIGELDEWMGRSIDRSTYTHTYMGHVYYMYIDADIRTRLMCKQKAQDMWQTHGHLSHSHMSYV